MASAARASDKSPRELVSVALGEVSGGREASTNNRTVSSDSSLAHFPPHAPRALLYLCTYPFSVVRLSLVPLRAACSLLIQSDLRLALRPAPFLLCSPNADQNAAKRAHGRVLGARGRRLGARSGRAIAHAPVFVPNPL